MPGTVLPLASARAASSPPQRVISPLSCERENWHSGKASRGLSARAEKRWWREARFKEGRRIHRVTRFGPVMRDAHRSTFML